MHKINSKNTCAIILCGGKGTRLGQIGSKKNKTLINYKNHPLIYHILKYLNKFNVNKAIIPLGYKGQPIKEYVNKEFKNNKFFCFNAGTNAPIIDRIKKSLKYIEGNYTNILILNGDSYYSFNLNKLVNYKLNSEKILINLMCTKLLLNYGFIEKNKKNENISFKYKSNFFESFQDDTHNKNYFYSGLCAINKSYLKKNINKLKRNFETELFNKASKINKLSYIYDDSLFFQVNTQEDLIAINESHK